MRFKIVATFTAALVSVALAACGGSDTASTSTSSTVTDNVTSTATATTPATTGAAITTGTAACTKAEITKAVSDLPSADYPNASLATGGGAPYKCGGGWAVAFINVGSGMDEVTTTVVWQGEGQFWVPQDRATVCPKPSKVPAAIYDLACNSN
jgi:hypothetical protein